MQRAGKVAEVAQDHYYPRSTLGELVEILIEVSHSQAEGWFTAAQFRDRVGLGRKVAIEILEFFDRVGVTMRRGDLRRPNPHQIGLFRD